MRYPPIPPVTLAGPQLFQPSVLPPESRRRQASLAAQSFPSPDLLPGIFFACTSLSASLCRGPEAASPGVFRRLHMQVGFPDHSKSKSYAKMPASRPQPRFERVCGVTGGREARPWTLPVAHGGDLLRQPVTLRDCSLTRSAEQACWWVAGRRTAVRLTGGSQGRGDSGKRGDGRELVS